jgi:hypothetical protein
MVDFKTLREIYSLVGFLDAQLGVPGKPVSGSLRYSTCPACGASSEASVKLSVRNDKWHCFGCGAKGDLIDAAAALWGKSPLEAAKALSEQDTPAPKSFVAPKPVATRNQGAINSVIAALLKAQGEPFEAALHYLVKERGLTKATVLEAIKRQVLITLPGDPSDAMRYLADAVGRDLLESSGLWKSGSKAPAAAYRPLAFVASDKTGIEFRLTEQVEGSAKAIRYGNPHPFIWYSSKPGVMLVEGAVDMLTAATLKVKQSIVGIPGVTNWKAEDPWVQDLKGHDVILA